MHSDTTGRLAQQAAKSALRLIKKRLYIDEKRQKEICKLVSKAGRELTPEQKKMLFELSEGQIPSKELLAYAATLSELAGEREGAQVVEIKLGEGAELSE